MLPTALSTDDGGLGEHLMGFNIMQLNYWSCVIAKYMQLGIRLWVCLQLQPNIFLFECLIRK